MYKTILAIAIGTAVFALAAPRVSPAQESQSPAPTRSEIDAQAMQHGPSTGRIGARTQRDPHAARRAEAPLDPRLMQPLNEREVGMLFNACVAYPECKTAYQKAYAHQQALLEAQRRAAAGEGH